jgi:GH18 family chitinase
MQAVGEYGTTSTYSIVGNLDDYIAAGVPAEHLVIGLPFYTKSWDTTVSGVYGQTGTQAGADSLNQANYDTLYRSSAYPKQDSIPLNHYTKWYTRLISGSTYRLTTFDDVQTLEYKMRLVKAWKGASSRGPEQHGGGGAEFHPHAGIPVHADGGVVCTPGDTCLPCGDFRTHLG